MSKEALLNDVKNFNLFKNTNEKVQYVLSKEERVTAAYSAWEKDKFDVKGISAVTKTGDAYIRLQVATIHGDKREYHNGALFKMKEKTGEKQPDFTGNLNLSNEVGGPVLRMAAWIKKGEKAGDYLSVAISEPRTKEEVAAAESQPVPAAAPEAPINESPIVPF